MHPTTPSFRGQPRCLVTSLHRSSPIDDGFLLLLDFFLVAPGPEGFDDQSQFSALLATDMPP